MSSISSEPNTERRQAVLHFCSLIEQSVLPAEFKEVMKQARIIRVEISTSEKKWRIHLMLDSLVRKKQLDEFAGEIPGLITGLAELDFIVRYNLPGIKPAEIIRGYWEDIIYVISKKHPALSGWMISASKKLEGDCLQIFVKSQVGSDIISHQRVPEQITELIRQEFGVEIKVTLHVVEEDECELTSWVAHQEAEYVKALKTQQADRPNMTSGSGVPGNKTGAGRPRVIIGKPISEMPVTIEKITEEEKNITVQGEIISLDIRRLKSGRSLLIFDLTDLTDSITVKFFEDEKEENKALKALSQGMWVKVRGPVRQDKVSQELTIMARDVNTAEFKARTDEAEEKRVELHLHTKMSAMDGVTGIYDAVSTAAKWGHPAIAITDHGVVQAFPDAYGAGRKYGVKIIFGMEGYLIDDGAPIVIKSHPGLLADEEFVVFDLETTGLSPIVNEIIEIGAVKMKQGLVVDRLARFVRPQNGIPIEIQRLTGILPEMVANAADIDRVLPEFMEFVGSATLVAHNAQFDTGFLRSNLIRAARQSLTNPVLDTLGLTRALLPKLKKHKLKNVAEEFSIPLENHHRAVEDAEATAAIFAKLLEMLASRNIIRLDEINPLAKNINIDKLRAYHVVLLVQNYTGLRNLYELVTMSHLNYFYRHPRVPRSELIKKRDGLLIGSACESGELICAYLDEVGGEKLEEIASFYDYLEIQPAANNEFLVRQGRIAGLDALRKMNEDIVQLGVKLAKPVAAAGDVHFLEPPDSLYRQMLLAGQGYEDAASQAPLYFKTTEEMLEEFSYLGPEKAKEVVITNPRLLAGQIEDIKPMPDDFFPPKIEGAEDQVTEMTWRKAAAVYGDPLPEVVRKRVEKELNSIITNGFAVLYLIAHKLVRKSNEDGYLVGSRGSVGSSFVATMTGITEVNPLPPHYICPACKYSEFVLDGSYGCGADLPDKDCPKCGSRCSKDGFDIPFEVFLGFKGDKVPDIDLNFSGEYQPQAHKYTEELFGTGHVFRAGTIGTIAEKTAYGFVQKYLEEAGTRKRKPETDRLVRGFTGVKRTTGQHPGGVMVIPRNMDVHDFTPLQYPADDKKSGIITTHFDYHSISGRIVKLDILGHDDPTMIKMLEDLTGVDAKNIPLDEPETRKIFSGVEGLGVTPEQICSKIGSYGIPEFGTKFVRQMLEDTRPTTFAELVRISGFSHGTDVWLNNAQDLIRGGVCRLAEAISTRDDIMIYLIHRGLEPIRSFKIMEAVRKGKGVTPEDEEYMMQHDVPEWYIGSCQKIKYMFPKAHAVAYVMMAYRIAYFKVHHPKAFYTAYFTVRADEFDADIVVQGSAVIKTIIKDLESKGNEASAKEKNLLTILEVALEMYERGIKMLRVDLKLSQAANFIITDEGLLPPFAALQGLGETAAKNIERARRQKEFTSVEDLRIRAKLSKNVIEIMRNHGCLNDLPETDQMSMF